MTFMTTTNNSRPRPPRPGTAARRLLEDQALQLREQGYTFAQIASAINSYPQIVGDMVRAASARRNLAARGFGVELEIIGLQPYAAARALTEAGLNAQDSGYTHSTTGYWKTLLDGSVYGGCEAVSPILYGEDGLTELTTAINALRQAGATVNTSTGMHVHVDARDLTGDEFGRTFAFYTERQDLFDMLVAPSRRHNTYCRKYDSRTIAQIKRVAQEQGKEQVRYAYDDRYMTVNVTSYGRHGTLEFRQHQGTLNATKAVSWVRLLLAIVTKVQACTEETVSATDLPAMIDGLGLPTDTARYLKARAARLAV